MARPTEATRAPSEVQVPAIARPRRLDTPAAALGALGSDDDFSEYPDSDDDDAGIGGGDQGEPESDKRRAESPPDGPAPRASKSRR